MPRKWKVEEEKGRKIKNFLLQKGGKEKSPSSYEKWRIWFPDATFTYYTNGTLYATFTPSSLEEIFSYIDSLIDPLFKEPTREYLLGLDEVGKGELIGDLIVVGALIKKDLFKRSLPYLSTIDTKRGRGSSYWKRKEEELKPFIKEIIYKKERISPQEIKEENLNALLDRAYRKIIEDFLKKVDKKKLRIVIDNYGVGKDFKAFLEKLRKEGVEVSVLYQGEDSYLEVKWASILAKIEKEKELEELRRNYPFGSGNPADKRTISWLRRYYKEHKVFPSFVRTSFKVVREMKGEVGQ